MNADILVPGQLLLTRIIHEPSDASFCKRLFSKGKTDFGAARSASPKKGLEFGGEFVANCR